MDLVFVSFNNSKNWGEGWACKIYFGSADRSGWIMLFLMVHCLLLLTFCVDLFVLS